MFFKQVIFKDLLDEENASPTGGIAIYKGVLGWDGDKKTYCTVLELEGVICGECGCWIEAEDIEILSTLDNWWSIDEAIQNNIKPDDTRGFRIEDQIKMEFVE